MKTRILLADDHQLMREGLKALLDQDDELTLVGEASDGYATLGLAKEANPHVVIMDVAMPDLNGIETTRQLVAESPHIKVIALSGHLNKEYVRQMLEAGASAYLLKTRAYEELSTAIREVMANRKYLSPDVAKGVVDEYVELSTSTQKNSAFILLTDREREVLQQISEGAATKEIAATLGLSVKTIETHRRNIMEKLDLHSVAELTKYAINEGITFLDA